MTTKLSLAEQETHIRYAADEKIVHIDTAIPSDIAYYDKLCKERPDYIKCIHRRDPYVFYEATRNSGTRLHAPRILSEETMQKYKERGKTLNVKSEAQKNNSNRSRKTKVLSDDKE